MPYAKAYASFGWTYWEESHWSSDPQHLDRAVALAQQAIALDDALPAAHSLVSLVYGRRQQYDRAIAEGASRSIEMAVEKRSASFRNVVRTSICEQNEQAAAADSRGI